MLQVIRFSEGNTGKQEGNGSAQDQRKNDFAASLIDIRMDLEAEGQAHTTFTCCDGKSSTLSCICNQ